MTATHVRPEPVELAELAERVPAPALKSAMSPIRTYDLSGGRCAVEAVLAPFGVAVWRVRLRALTIRLVEHDTGGATLTAHLSARPRFASLPATAGLFMPATGRDEILTLTAELPPLADDTAAPATGVVARGPARWPADLSVRMLARDDDRLLATVRGTVARRDELPLPSLRLGIDAAMELCRCD